MYIFARSQRWQGNPWHYEDLTRVPLVFFGRSFHFSQESLQGGMGGMGNAANDNSRGVFFDDTEKVTRHAKYDK